MIDRTDTCFYSAEDGGFIAVGAGPETLSAFGDSVESARDELERVSRAAQVPTPGVDPHLAMGEAELRKHLLEHSTPVQKFDIAARYNRMEAILFFHQQLYEVALDDPQGVEVFCDEEVVRAFSTMFEALSWVSEQGNAEGYRVGPLHGERLAEVVGKMRAKAKKGRQGRTL